MHSNYIAEVEMYLPGSVGVGLSSPQVREHHSIVILDYFWFSSLLLACVLLNNTWKLHPDVAFTWETEPWARAYI